jgi:hypothetical protein
VGYRLHGLLNSLSQCYAEVVRMLMDGFEAHTWGQVHPLSRLEKLHSPFHIYDS